MSNRPAPFTIIPHAIAWDDVVDGVRQKTIWTQPMWDDPSVPRRMSMKRYEPGAKGPLHRQVSGDEIVYVVEGILSDESGDVTAGNVAYRPNGCVSTEYSPSGATTVSILVGNVEPVSEMPSDSPSTQIFEVNAMPWQSTEPGIQEKKVWHDSVGKRRLMFIRVDPGVVVRLHEHLGEELAMPLEGSMVDEAGLLGPGDVGFRPFGCHHSWVTENGLFALAYIWGRSQYVVGEES